MHVSLNNDKANQFLASCFGYYFLGYSFLGYSFLGSYFFGSSFFGCSFAGSYFLCTVFTYENMGFIPVNVWNLRLPAFTSFLKSNY